MNLILFENNDASNICFKIAESYYGDNGSNLCLYYDTKREYRIGYADDNYIKHVVKGGAVVELSYFGEKRCSEDANIYLLNESNLNTNQLAKKLSKHINKKNIIKFSEKDFKEFKKYCKSLAKKLCSEKLDSLDDYVEYLNDSDLDQCIEKNNYETQVGYMLLIDFVDMLEKKGINY